VRAPGGDGRRAGTGAGGAPSRRPTSQSGSASRDIAHTPRGSSRTRSWSWCIRYCSWFISLYSSVAMSNSRGCAARHYLFRIASPSLPVPYYPMRLSFPPSSLSAPPPRRRLLHPPPTCLQRLQLHLHLSTSHQHHQCISDRILILPCNAALLRSLSTCSVLCVRLDTISNLGNLFLEIFRPLAILFLIRPNDEHPSVTPNCLLVLPGWRSCSVNRVLVSNFSF